MKVKISTLLKTDECNSIPYQCIGMLKDNQLLFYENKVRVTITMQGDSVFMKRVHPDYVLSMQFTNSLTNEGIYDIKCDSVQMVVEVFTSVLEVKNGSLHVEYNLVLGGENQGMFIYDITYEVIE
mgnify:CR=1 FL=1